MENIEKICTYNGVDIIHIFEPAKTLSKDPELKKKVLSECERVQLEVWDPMMSIEDNTINNDGLVLLMKDDHSVGFISYQIKKYDDKYVMYFHDLMISKKYQGKGLYRIALLSSILTIAEKYDTVHFTGMTITYNARVIKSLYFKPHIFRNISFPRLNVEHRYLVKKMGADFFDEKNLHLDKGIIEGMWKPSRRNGQHLVDYSELSDLFGPGLSPETGDSLVLLFDIDAESVRYIRNFLNERVVRN